MAQTLGTITVRLGLDAAEFTSGLTKSEVQAQKFARQLDQNLQSATRFIASLGIGAAVGIFVKNTIDAAGSLNDLSDATGSSIANLSKLANQAKVSGTDFETLKGLVLKLSAGMAGADDESSNVGRALKALGVDAKDPAEALQQVAIKLNTYADGIGKAAIARDLFGKGGPAFLHTLKDIAESQDISATVTAKQAEEADKLEKAWRRLGVEGTTLKNVILNDVVPAATRMIEEFTLGIKISGGFFAALGNFGSINPFKTTQQNITDTDERIKNIIADAPGEGKWINALGISDKVLAALKQRGDYLRAQQSREALAGASALGFTGDARDLKLAQKPTLDYTGTKEKKASEGVDEFARALKEAQKIALDAKIAFDDIGKSLDDKTSPAMKHLEELLIDPAFLKFTVTQRGAIAAILGTADATQHLTGSIERQQEAATKAIEADEKAAEARQKLIEHNLELASGYRLGNETLERELAIIGQDDLAHQKLTATLEYERLKREAIKNGASQPVLDALDDEYARRIKLLGAYDAQAKALSALNDIKTAFKDPFADALVSVVEHTKGIKQAVGDMVKGITHNLSELAAKRIADSLGDALFGPSKSGSGGGGGGLLDLVPKLLGAAGGGGGADDLLGFLLERGLLGAAAGGTDFASGGPTLVGERGPEIVNMPRGAQVIPNDVLMARRESRTTVLNQTVNVMPGASRMSADQAAVMAGRQASRALQRNG